MPPATSTWCSDPGLGNPARADASPPPLPLLIAQQILPPPPLAPRPLLLPSRPRLSSRSPCPSWARGRVESAGVVVCEWGAGRGRVGCRGVRERGRGKRGQSGPPRLGGAHTRRRARGLFNARGTSGCTEGEDGRRTRQRTREGRSSTGEGGDGWRLRLELGRQSKGRSPHLPRSNPLPSAPRPRAPPTPSRLVIACVSSPLQRSEATLPRAPLLSALLFRYRGAGLESLARLFRRPVSHPALAQPHPPAVERPERRVYSLYSARFGPAASHRGAPAPTLGETITPPTYLGAQQQMEILPPAAKSPLYKTEMCRSYTMTGACS
jgi:hypothetical protein